MNHFFWQNAGEARLLSAWTVGLLQLFLAGCGQSNASSAETCTTAAQCPHGLECRANHCVEPASATTGGDASQDVTTTTEGGDPQHDACVAGQRFCHANAVYQCRGDGQGAVHIDDCKAGFRCDPASAVCAMLFCEPNQPVCQGNWATLCNSDGSGVVAGGSDCALAGQMCVHGLCATPLCQPLSFGCVDGNVHQCSSDGLTTLLYQTCSAGTYCQPGMSQCLPQVCEPQQPTCDGARATVCNANGSGYEPGGTDCTALGLPCNNGICTSDTGDDDDDSGDDDDDGSGDDDDDDDDDQTTDESGDHCSKVDFVIMIDNSRSMGDEQAHLIESFPTLIAQIEEENGIKDYRILVQKTDSLSKSPSECTESACTCVPLPPDNTVDCCIDRCAHAEISTCDEKPCTEFPENRACIDRLGTGVTTRPDGTMCNVTSGASYLNADQPDLADVFACVATVGIEGNSGELMIDALLTGLSKEANAADGCNAGFLREDAMLAVVLITDEEEKGPGPDKNGSFGDPALWKTKVLAIKDGREDKIFVAGLIGDVGIVDAICQPIGPGSTDGAEESPRLREFIASFGATHSHIGSVCAPDYAPIFKEMTTKLVAACGATP